MCYSYVFNSAFVNETSFFDQIKFSELFLQIRACFFNFFFFSYILLNESHQYKHFRNTLQLTIKDVETALKIRKIRKTKQNKVTSEGLTRGVSIVQVKNKVSGHFY